MSDHYVIIGSCDIKASYNGSINRNSFNQQIFMKGGVLKFRKVLSRSDWSFLIQFTTFGEKFSEWYSKITGILREICIRKASKALDNIESE